MLRRRGGSFAEQCLAYRHLLCQQCKEEQLRRILSQMNSRKINIHTGLSASRSDVGSVEISFLDVNMKKDGDVLPDAESGGCNKTEGRPDKSVNFRYNIRTNNKQLLHQTATFLRRIPISKKETHTFGSQSRLMSSGTEDKVKVKRIYARSPFRWIDIKVKMFLMRSFFDQEFDEREFLNGARQAICLVSSYISDGKFEKLSGMLSDKAKEDSKELHYHNMDKKSLKVFDDEIDNVSLSNMDFVYDGKGRKFADILVTCHCIAEDFVSKKIGNIEMIGPPPQRIYNFSFIREFTPGVTANWIVDRITYYKTFSVD
eukprot:Seg402.3 transcript_id=Seg402.3/GoldUCD/mRNA.D3Y31 product="m-AAA protease-interacting protein 1 mitochondrial" protein_id=Seg402.3/GoldUCD/D3Y31